MIQQKEFFYFHSINSIFIPNKIIQILSMIL